MKDISALLKESSPLAYKEFEDFVNENFSESLSKIEGGLPSLDFTFHLGVFLAFFNDQAIEFEMDLINWDIDGVKESVVETFENFEKVIAHYS